MDEQQQLQDLGLHLLGRAADARRQVRRQLVGYQEHCQHRVPRTQGHLRGRKGRDRRDGFDAVLLHGASDQQSRFALRGHLCPAGSDQGGGTGGIWKEDGGRESKRCLIIGKGFRMSETLLFHGTEVSGTTSPGMVTVGLFLCQCTSIYYTRSEFI